MRIKRPTLFTRDNRTGEGVNAAFKIWFKHHVEPINKVLAEGVEVYGKSGLLGSWAKDFEGNHKALLIKIEPIKEDTAEDILRDYVKLCNDADSNPHVSYREGFDNLFLRSKKLLEGK